jgi:V8-like Glu-specific endopeptidase
MEPFCLIGFIQIFTPQGLIKAGTGILISTDLVLTCAHNIFII